MKANKQLRGWKFCMLYSEHPYSCWQFQTQTSHQLWRPLHNLLSPSQQTFSSPKKGFQVTLLEQRLQKNFSALKMYKLESIWQWPRIQTAQVSFQLPNTRAGNMSFPHSVFPTFSSVQTFSLTPSRADFYFHNYTEQLFEISYWWGSLQEFVHLFPLSGDRLKYMLLTHVDLATYKFRYNPQNPFKTVTLWLCSTLKRKIHLKWRALQVRNSLMLYSTDRRGWGFFLAHIPANISSNELIFFKISQTVSSVTSSAINRTSECTLFKQFIFMQGFISLNFRVNVSVYEIHWINSSGIKITLETKAVNAVVFAQPSAVSPC